MSKPSFVLSLALLGVMACHDRPTAPPAVVVDPPALLHATPRQAPENVLSARIAYSAPIGQRVRVGYWSATDAMQRTPYRLSLGTGVDTVVLLGLRPQHSYSVIVEGSDDGLTWHHLDTASFVTEALPAAL